MKRTIQLITAGVLLSALTACSQQQVADGGSSQVAGSSQQVQNAEVKGNNEDCKTCNTPIVKPIPTKKPIVKRPPTKKPPVKQYSPRRHVGTIPNKKNASSALVKNIQNALRAKGYNPGNTDGVMGTRTISALNAFQKAKRLPRGLNARTFKALGVSH